MTAHFTFRGETLLLDPAGVLVWPRLSLLAVADLHLEKGTACAGRGQLVPPWDSFATLTRLADAVRRHAPRTVVAVGDSFHDAHAATRLSAGDAAMLAGIGQAAQLVWVRGNHDPLPPAGVAGHACETFLTEGLLFRHQAASLPLPDAPGEVSGHFHPKARVATRVGEIVRPCFMTDVHRIMLPSFGAYTGGLDVRSPAIARHYPDGGRAFLLGRDRVFCFSIPAEGDAAGPTPCDDAVPARPAARRLVATGGRAHRFW
jgi:DNA ligase-associated metallophosphoesterase